MCFVRLSEQTAVISLYNTNWLVFITEAESVYCAVRTESLNKTDTVSSLKSDLIYIGWFISVGHYMNMMQRVYSRNEADLFPLSGSRTETVVCSSRQSQDLYVDIEEGFLISVKTRIVLLESDFTPS